MFERFTNDSRAVVAGAQDEARELRQSTLGTEHLLLAMLGPDGRDGLAGQLLTEHGLTRESIKVQLTGERLDSDALATLGIDLDEVRRAAEEQFGPGALSDGAKGARDVPRGHIPFSKPAKKVLELSVREAVRLGADRINSAHLLLGVIRENGQGADLIKQAGVDLDQLTADAGTRAAREAA
jgi:ATP-dependent Clp protease ATP-binding subunit ClpA